MFLVADKLFRMWWPGTESNRRRQPFQGCAINHLQTNFLWFHKLAGAEFGRHLDSSAILKEVGLQSDSTFRGGGLHGLQFQGATQ